MDPTSFFAAFALGRDPVVEKAKPAPPPVHAPAPSEMHPTIPTGPFPPPPADAPPSLPSGHAGGPDAPPDAGPPVPPAPRPSENMASKSEAHAHDVVVPPDRPAQGVAPAPAPAVGEFTSQGHRGTPVIDPSIGGREKESAPTLYKTRTRDGYVWTHADPEYLRRWAMAHDASYVPAQQVAPAQQAAPAWSSPLSWGWMFGGGGGCAGGSCR